MTRGSGRLQRLVIDFLDIPRWRGNFRKATVMSAIAPIKTKSGSRSYPVEISQ